MSSAALPRAPEAPGWGALLLRVSGVVQGVGFRPFVHRLALRHRLDGWIRNTGGEVEIAVEGQDDAVEHFVGALRTEAPPLARVDAINATPLEESGLGAFRVLESVSDGQGRQLVSPDVATCAACEAELYDPSNRRYRYPFITCTDCGPRHSVIEAMPYDRERTTMRVFTQCADCRREYGAIGDRRYHSETNSCPTCGPHLRFLAGTPPAPVETDTEGAIAHAARALRHGWIVAIRGIGGFHLAVDATNEDAVARLRERKRRDAKPFAVMVRTVAQARRTAVVSEREAGWLSSPERPIVVLRRRDSADEPGVAPSVSGALGTIGMMLPYAPLQMLLLDAVGVPLVMTSGNESQMPLVASLEEALVQLGGIADAFLTHDREIVARIDDSVLRVADATAIHMRRARGFAPLPVALPSAAPVPLVAVGAHLKNTFALVNGRDAFISQHIGDLETVETMDHWRASLGAFRRFFGIEPLAAVHDMHPGYLSTRLAEELGLPQMIAVQHHHAHVAAVAAEHGVTAPVLGVAFDGTGYGEDGNIWGAEVLVADLRGYRRVARLRYGALPGGDLAVRTPWRVALGYLGLDPSAEPAFARAFDGVDAQEIAVAVQQIERGVNTPEASSMGRLFDAAAAVLGVCRISRFEGEAAMRLESLAGTRLGEILPFDVVPARDGTLALDPLPLLRALGERLARGRDVATLAASFHESIVAGTVRLLTHLAEREALHTVALGGGCFQNGRLLATLRDRLRARGLEVLVPRALPPNDGGVSYGQAAIAAARLEGIG